MTGLCVKDYKNEVFDDNRCNGFIKHRSNIKKTKTKHRDKKIIKIHSITKTSKECSQNIRFNLQYLLDQTK